MPAATITGVVKAGLIKTRSPFLWFRLVAVASARKRKKLRSLPQVAPQQRQKLLIETHAIHESQSRDGRSLAMEQMAA
jgi:hypothetical protein